MASASRPMSIRGCPRPAWDQPARHIPLTQACQDIQDGSLALTGNPNPVETSIPAPELVSRSTGHFGRRWHGRAPRAPGPAGTNAHRPPVPSRIRPRGPHKHTPNPLPPLLLPFPGPFEPNRRPRGCPHPQVRPHGNEALQVPDVLDHPPALALQVLEVAPPLGAARDAVGDEAVDGGGGAGGAALREGVALDFSGLEGGLARRPS